MNNFPKPYIVDQLKKDYPPGTRVMLLDMDDPYSKLRPGDRATVVHVDDIGTVHCKWDNGSGLGLAYGEDKFRKLTENEIAEEQGMEKQNEAQTGGMEM